ncbi:putative uncharacterized protein DDB_G0282133 [Macrobrachium nipponense]|uniref:putative uncharacterized protein DDB_G0282133 n=1 Tax=Macrobrachium nipponense TaxID=159736 RepID=UPI0030C7DEDC
MSSNYITVNDNISIANYATTHTKTSHEYSSAPNVSFSNATESSLSFGSNNNSNGSSGTNNTNLVNNNYNNSNVVNLSNSSISYVINSLNNTIVISGTTNGRTEINKSASSVDDYINRQTTNNVKMPTTDKSTSSYNSYTGVLNNALYTSPKNNTAAKTYSASDVSINVNSSTPKIDHTYNITNSSSGYFPFSSKSSPQHRDNLILSNASSQTFESAVVPKHSSTSSTSNTGFVNSTFSTKSNSKHDFSLNTTNIDFTQYIVRNNSITNHYPTSATVSSKNTSKLESNIFSTSGNNSNISLSSNSSKRLIEKRHIESRLEHKTDSSINGMTKITGFHERQNLTRFKRIDEDQTATRNTTRNNWLKKNVYPIPKKAQGVSADGNSIQYSSKYKLDFISYDNNSGIITIRGNANISRLIINYNNKQRDQVVIDFSTKNITKASTEPQDTDPATYVKRMAESADRDFVVKSHASQHMIPEHHQSARNKVSHELKKGKLSKDRKKQGFSKMAGKSKKLLQRKRKTKVDARKHNEKLLPNTGEVQGHNKKTNFGSKRNGKVNQKSVSGIVFDKESGNLIIPVNSSISTIIVDNGGHTSLIIINPDSTITIVDDYLNSDIPSRRSSSQALSSPSTLPETQGAHHTQSLLVFSKSETENLETIISNIARPTQPSILSPVTSKAPDLSYLQTPFLVPPIPVSKETALEMTTDLLHKTEAVSTSKLAPASKITTEKVTAAASLTKSIVTEMRPSSTILEAMTHAVNMPVLTATLPTIKIPRTTEQEIDIDVEKAITTKESHVKVSATTAMSEKARSGIVTEKLPTISVPVTTLATDTVPKTIMSVEILSPKAPKTTLHEAVTSPENRHSVTSHKLPETTVTVPAIVTSALPPESVVTAKEGPSTAPYVTMKATEMVQITVLW